MQQCILHVLSNNKFCFILFAVISCYIIYIYNNSIDALNNNFKMNAASFSDMQNIVPFIVKLVVMIN